MPLKVSILICFILVGSIDIYAINQDKKKLRFFTKPLLIPLLMFYYSMSTTKINVFIIIALSFCFLGDFFLLFANRKSFLMAGLFSFLIGHVFYVYIFLKSTFFLSIIPLWFYIFLLPYIYYGKLIYYRVNLYLNALKFPVIVYLLVILVMSFTALTRIWIFNGYAFWLTYIGTIMFIASDTLLAFRTFKHKMSQGWISIMILYICAQFFIVSGLLEV